MGAEAVLRLFQAEVASMLLLNVVAVVVAPMGAVFFLDEASVSFAECCTEDVCRLV